MIKPNTLHVVDGMLVRGEGRKTETGTYYDAVIVHDPTQGTMTICCEPLPNEAHESDWFQERIDHEDGSQTWVTDIHHMRITRKRRVPNSRIP